MKKLLLGLTATIITLGAAFTAAQAECVPHREIALVRPPIYAPRVVDRDVVYRAPVYVAPVYPAPAIEVPVYDATAVVIEGGYVWPRHDYDTRLHRLHAELVHHDRW